MRSSRVALLAVNGAAGGRERILVVIFVARGDRLDGGVDERNLRREEIAKQS